MSHWRNETTITRLLREAQVWAVVGLDDNPTRTAYAIAQWLMERGKTIVPVHHGARTVLGQQGYARLADVPGHIDVVDVFVRSEYAGDVVDDAVTVGAGAVWLQLGVIDESAALRAEAAGLDVVMDTCPHIEAPRLLGWPR